MSIRRSVLLTAVCLGIAAAFACGGSGSPTSPSPSGGGSATIAGTVRSAAASAPAGMNVTVVGTSVSAAVDGAGAFELPGVPPGNVQLQFKNSSTTRYCFRPIKTATTSAATTRWGQCCRRP